MNAKQHEHQTAWTPNSMNTKQHERQTAWTLNTINGGKYTSATECQAAIPNVKRHAAEDLNGRYLFAARSPTDTVSSQNFQTFSTRQIAFLVAERPMPAMLLRLSASVCRRYLNWPHWQWNRYGQRRPKPRNTTSWRLMSRANNNNMQHGVRGVQPSDCLGIKLEPSRDVPCQERPIPTQPYPEQHTWTAVWSVSPPHTLELLRHLPTCDQSLSALSHMATIQTTQPP